MNAGHHMQMPLFIMKRMCSRACVCIHVCECVCVSFCMHRHWQMCACANVCADLRVFACVCRDVCILVCMCVCACVCACVHKCLCACVCGRTVYQRQRGTLWGTLINRQPFGCISGDARRQREPLCCTRHALLPIISTPNAAVSLSLSPSLSLFK